MDGVGSDAEEPIPLSALQHAVYCLRQAALIHVDRLWAENRFTAEGQVVHLSANDPARRSGRGGVRRVTALPIACRRLGLAGVADLVEFTRDGRGGECAFPVEYKRGKPKPHRADEVQLCAQALCLEEMLGRPVPEGALFYAETKRRMPVAFDADLRSLTETTAAEMAAVLRSGQLPVVPYKSTRCRGCSLQELCRPRLQGRSAAGWAARSLAALLAEDGN